MVLLACKIEPDFTDNSRKQTNKDIAKTTFLFFLIAHIGALRPAFCKLSNIVLANNKIVLVCNNINNYLCNRIKMISKCRHKCQPNNKFEPKTTVHRYPKRSATTIIQPAGSCNFLPFRHLSHQYNQSNPNNNGFQL